MSDDQSSKGTAVGAEPGRGPSDLTSSDSTASENVTDANSASKSLSSRHDGIRAATSSDHRRTKAPTLSIHSDRNGVLLDAAKYHWREEARFALEADVDFLTKDDGEGFSAFMTYSEQPEVFWQLHHLPDGEEGETRIRCYYSAKDSTSGKIGWWRKGRGWRSDTGSSPPIATSPEAQLEADCLCSPKGRVYLDPTLREAMATDFAILTASALRARHGGWEGKDPLGLAERLTIADGLNKELNKIYPLRSKSPRDGTKFASFWDLWWTYCLKGGSRAPHATSMSDGSRLEPTSRAWADFGHDADPAHSSHVSGTSPVAQPSSRSTSYNPSGVRSNSPPASGSKSESSNNGDLKGSFRVRLKSSLKDLRALFMPEVKKE